MEIIEKFVSHKKNAQSCVLCTIVESLGSTPRKVGSAMIVFAGGKIEGTVGGGVTEHNVIKRALEMSACGDEFSLYREDLKGGETVCGGSVAVFMQSSRLADRVVIFGAGHVGRAVAQCATFAGFDVLTWDEREEFANEQNIKHGRVVCCPINEAEDKIKFDENCYFVVMTRGHALDAEVLRMLSKNDKKYVGAIGSRKKIAFVREKLLKEGVSEKYLDSVHQPIGVPINAETPEEIAVSVTAELIKIKRRGFLE